MGITYCNKSIQFILHIRVLYDGLTYHSKYFTYTTVSQCIDQSLSASVSFCIVCLPFYCVLVWLSVRYEWVSVSIYPPCWFSKTSTSFNKSKVEFLVQLVSVVSQNRSHLSFIHCLCVILLPTNLLALLICLSNFPLQLQPWFKLPPPTCQTKRNNATFLTTSATCTSN